MGSDGFKSKSLKPLPATAGVHSSGAASADSFEFEAGSDRTLDPFVGVTDASAANLVEISGVIKWFDVSKGYGFIVPDDGAPDVLLHVTVLRRDGYQAAHEGARIVCECLQRAKGYQAFRIVSIDEVHCNSSGTDAAGANPCQRDGDERARARSGEMVQPLARLRLPDVRRGHA